MNYIYDIYLNLNDVLYDFFDWNKSDKITHIKKIPIFKISENSLKILINNTIKINNLLLENIKNKTEVWNMTNKIEFCSIFSDDSNMIAIEFDEFGNSKKKSFLQIDEELEILETVYKFKEKELNFEIVEKENNLLKTRNQVKEESFIEKELKNIENDKLKYIYFECFGKHEKNRKKILNNLNKISKSSKTYKNLYNILKLTSEAKNT